MNSVQVGEKLSWMDENVTFDFHTSTNKTVQWVVSMVHTQYVRAMCAIEDSTWIIRREQIYLLKLPALLLLDHRNEDDPEMLVPGS